MQEIFNLIPRPKWAKMIKVLDRAETEIFKKLFDDWEEIISVDHSRRVGHVSGNNNNEAICWAILTASIVQNSSRSTR